ncbi:trypsin-like [Phymastichus coffea]|uniref:trypsin-like n=1 Tax=Phymastichus coffea TaxID=108790 RepID=UPI00273C93D2|nr:trypsin-like [Phymastichus coffea]
MINHSLTVTMIQFPAYIFLITQVFILIKADPLEGKHVFPVEPPQFPFIVSLRQKSFQDILTSQHFCTGSLITQKHVITAAHCFQERIEFEVEAIVSQQNWTRPSLSYEIDSWLTYNSWAPANGKTIEFPINDVAIVKLSLPICHDGITPAHLTNLNNKQLYGTKAMIVGWVGIYDNSSTMHLLQGKVTILRPSKSEHLIKLVANRKIKVNENYLATFAKPYILASCGDSGGPLLDNNNFLVGITRSTCPKIYWGDFPEEFLNHYKINLHSSVDYYREFIENVTTLAEVQ